MGLKIQGVNLYKEIIDRDHDISIDQRRTLIKNKLPTQITICKMNLVQPSIMT